MSASKNPVISNRPALACFDLDGTLFEGQSPGDFVMVGDTAADIGFAQAAGIASCWVSYGYGDADTCRSMKPDFVVDTLSDLLADGVEVGSA